MLGKIRVSIIGATGYTGFFLLKILRNHRFVEVQRVTSRSEAGVPLAEVFGCFLYDKQYQNLSFSAYKDDDITSCSDVVFLCLPHTESMTLIEPLLRHKGLRVIDLSADFRLRDPQLYKQFYAKEHLCPQLIEQAVYGLPELYRSRLMCARFVANPGCFPTAVLTGAAPLLREKIIEPDDIVIDAKTGASGAGRTLSQRLHFPELNDNMVPYKVGTHQHVGEIEQELSVLFEGVVRVVFVPHLMPVNQGIVATQYFRLRRSLSEEELRELYRTFYRDAQFVRILPAGKIPESRQVMNTNFCDISITIEKRTGRLIVISSLDNMWKGASGQAVQNMNIMCGFDESEGL